MAINGREGSGRAFAGYARRGLYLTAKPGKLFAFNCFDGSRGAGRIYGDGSVIGTIQFRGAGSARTVSLPAGTLRVRGEAVCASLQSMPFEPCFHIEKTDDRSFRGSLSGLGFAYCDFTRLTPSCVPPQRSSNANSLCGQNSAGSPQICATFQRDNLRRHF